MVVFHNYLIRITNPKIPGYVYAMFPKITSDRELMGKVYRMYRLGHDAEYSRVYLSMRREASIITRVLSYSIVPERTSIRMRLANDMTAYASLSLFGTDDPDELLDMLRQPMIMTVRYVKGYLVVSHIDIPRLRSYRDAAREIINDVGIYQALLIGYGLIPSKDILFAYMPRIIGLFRGYSSVDEDEPYRSIHVVQFTAPNSGKTHWGIRTTDIVNYEYLSGEFPTLSRLVYDARNNSVGIVGLRDGVIMDEFDKKAYMETQRLALDLKVLLSGLEQGIWTRGAGKRVEIRRHVNFILFGNIPYQQHTSNTRRMITSYYKISGIDAFIDRFAVVDMYPEPLDISRYILHRILPNSIMRGIIDLVYERLRPMECSVDMRGRHRIHCLNVKSILYALGIELPDEWIAEWIRGETNTYQLNKRVKYEDINIYFTEYDKYLRALDELEEAGGGEEE